MGTSYGMACLDHKVFARLGKMAENGPNAEGWPERLLAFLRPSDWSSAGYRNDHNGCNVTLLSDHGLLARDDLVELDWDEDLKEWMTPKPAGG